MTEPAVRSRRATAQDQSVIIAGTTGDPIRLEPSKVSAQGLSTLTRRMAYDCASEGRRTGRWRGLPLLTLLDWADIEPRATHLLVEAVDGHAVCIAIERVREGMLALERLRADGETVRSPAQAVPRLLAPGIDAAQTVKGVRRLTAFRCNADQDPRAVVGLAATV